MKPLEQTIKETLITLEELQTMFRDSDEIKGKDIMIGLEKATVAKTHIEGLLERVWGFHLL